VSTAATHDRSHLWIIEDLPSATRETRELFRVAGSAIHLAVQCGKGERDNREGGSRGNVLAEPIVIQKTPAAVGR
jgi:hypothetical protein